MARITPFLIELARENYEDIPEVLSQYEGMDSDKIADEQDRRVTYFREARKERMNQGLGGIAKLARRTVEVEPELGPQQSFNAPSQLTSKDLIGAAPPSMAASSGLMGFLNRRQEEKEEESRRKFEKWNEVMLKKQKDREARANS